MTALPERLVRAVRRRLRRRAGLSPLQLPPGEAPAGMPVLFVGGTGRSGTTVLGRLLGSHPDFVNLPAEIKFITEHPGLAYLLGGAVSFDEFETFVRGQAFENRFGRGLHMMTDIEAVNSLLPRLRAGLDRDPWSATAAFVHDLLDPVATAAGTRGWIDTTPANASQAGTLMRLFPNMRLVHMVRDGRDVALSVTRRRWGPDDLEGALDWWARRLERSFVACEGLPESHVLTLHMEDLFVRDRERSFERLLAFVGLSPDPAIVRYFEEETPANKAHAGRWRRDVPAELVVAFEAHHARRATALRARGRPYRPFEPDQARERELVAAR